MTRDDAIRLAYLVAAILFILGLKFLAVVAFVCIVNWIVRSIAGTGGISGMDSVTVMPQPASATAPQPDVRF